jgi:hypothetical protein
VVSFPLDAGRGIGRIRGGEWKSGAGGGSYGRDDCRWYESAARAYDYYRGGSDDEKTLARLTKKSNDYNTYDAADRLAGVANR